METAIGILIETALNLQTALSSKLILAVVTLPIHEHGMSCHLFMLSSISLISVLQISEYRSFTSLGRFISSVF